MHNARAVSLSLSATVSALYQLLNCSRSVFDPDKFAAVGAFEGTLTPRMLLAQASRCSLKQKTLGLNGRALEVANFTVAVCYNMTILREARLDSWPDSRSFLSSTFIWLAFSPGSSNLPLTRALGRGFTSAATSNQPSL